MNRMRAAAAVAAIAAALLVGLSGSAQAGQVSYPCASVLPPFGPNQAVMAFGCQGPAGHHQWVSLHRVPVGPSAFCRDVYASNDNNGTVTVGGYECV